MKRIAFFAMIGLLSWGAPAFAGSNPDLDGDGVGDVIDNCSEKVNAAQDDTDADGCGNICDADYDQTGLVDFGDFGIFVERCFGFGVGPGNYDPLCDHTEPIGGGGINVIDFGDFGAFASMFGGVPGPSGSTAGTIACP
jgi:hypothetical protein